MTFTQKLALAAVPVLGAVFVALIQFPDVLGRHSLVVAGVIQDDATGAPVPPAGDVAVFGRSESDTIHNHGMFRIDLQSAPADGSVQLVISAPHYKSYTSIPLKVPQERFLVRLVPVPDSPPDQPKLKRADLEVAPQPDTLTMKLGEFSQLRYAFTERAGIDAKIETQDAQFFTLSGLPVGLGCTRCRILGGGFTVRAGQTFSFVDNLALPPEVVQQVRAMGFSIVNLRTTFNALDGNHNETTATAVVRIQF